MSTPILFIGATGYIGGSVLAKLLNHPSVNTFDITAVLRSPEKAKILEEKFKIKTVIGSNESLDVLEKLASEAHVVFSTSDADNLPAVKAILRGLKARHAKVGDLPILIHTSGTGVLTTDDRGLAVGSIVYDDSIPESIESISDTAPHREVDLEVVKADKEGYVQTHIILPSTIYGIANHALVQAHVSNPYSQQIPALIKIALARDNVPGVIGKGIAVWPSVHWDDNAELFIILFDAIVKSRNLKNEGEGKIGHGRNGFYFGISGNHSWYDISKQIGRVLVELGRTTSDEPTTFAENELEKYFGPSRGSYYGTSSRGIPNHSNALGWKPTRSTEDTLASIKPEVEAIIKNGGF